MSEWVARKNPEITGWFADKICICDRYMYDAKSRPWQDLAKCESPPLCMTCGKWGDRVMTCCSCNEYFYMFFQHPSSGYHPKPKRGWYCWNCLEREYPPIVEPYRARTRVKIPPPSIVLPPGYELVKPPVFDL